MQRKEYKAIYQAGNLQWIHRRSWTTCCEGRCRDYSTCARFDLFQKNTTVEDEPGRSTDTRLIRTPINAGNGHLFHAQSTDSHRKSTSLKRILHCQVCEVIDLSFLKVIKTFSWQHVHVPSATVHRKIRRRQFPTTLACIKQVMQRTDLDK